MEDYSVAFLTTTIVSSTKVKTTSAVTSTTSDLSTTTTSSGSIKSDSLIPLQEFQKDIILLSLVGVVIFCLLVIICIMTRNKRRQNGMAMEFQNLTASSSTTVFDKRQ